MGESLYSHGLCSAIRPKVLTAIDGKYGFKEGKNFWIHAWGVGQYGTDSEKLVSDEDIMAREHFALITYSDAPNVGAWIEWLLYQWGGLKLIPTPDRPAQYPSLKWDEPKDCSTTGRLARMPIEWSSDEYKRLQQQKQLVAQLERKGAGPSHKGKQTKSKQAQGTDWLGWLLGSKRRGR